MSLAYKASTIKSIFTYSIALTAGNASGSISGGLVLEFKSLECKVSTIQLRLKSIFTYSFALATGNASGSISGDLVLEFKN